MMPKKRVGREKVKRREISYIDEFR